MYDPVARFYVRPPEARAERRAVDRLHVPPGVRYTAAVFLPGDTHLGNASADLT